MDTPSQTDTETCMSATLEKCGIFNFERIISKAVTLKQTPVAIVKVSIPKLESYYIANSSNSKEPHMVNVKSTDAVLGQQ